LRQVSSAAGANAGPLTSLGDTPRQGGKPDPGEFLGLNGYDFGHFAGLRAFPGRIRLPARDIVGRPPI